VQHVRLLLADPVLRRGEREVRTNPQRSADLPRRQRNRSPGGARPHAARDARRERVRMSWLDLAAPLMGVTPMKARDRSVRSCPSYRLAFVGWSEQHSRFIERGAVFGPVKASSLAPSWRPSPQSCPGGSFLLRIGPAWSF